MKFKIYSIWILFVTLSVAGNASAKNTELFGETHLAPVRVKEGAAPYSLEFEILGCFPSRHGGNTKAECSPKHRLGDTIHAAVFFGSRFHGEIKFTYQKSGKENRFIASVDSKTMPLTATGKQGFVVDPATLATYMKKIAAAKKSGTYAQLKMPDKSPSQFERYDVDRDGVTDFLFLQPSNHNESQILIHEPGQKNWVVF